MVDWFYIGYCTVMAMFAVAFAYAAAFGFRALRRLPRSLLLGFATAAIVATLTAQKTNNVPPNMNQPQMQQGGGSFQTGFTRLTGFAGEGNLVNLVNPVYTTSGDIARGWRVECAATNENISYEMPSNGSLVGNLHVHGAASSFGNNVVDFGVVRTSGTLVPTNWAFPIGTNNAAFSSFWYFVDGRIRPTPKDAMREICAVGVPMSAVPGQSRLWRLDGDDGSRILTWENFFLGGDTNAPVNAQIVLCPNGDFVTRSNEVETVCRRVNPDDWDNDGIANERDANPLFCDGDFFGVANALPPNANPDAYYWLDLSVTGVLGIATIRVTCDGPSDLGDHLIVARTNEVCHVPLLAGATYAVESDLPIDYSAVSTEHAEIVTNAENRLTVSLPLEFSLVRIQTRSAGTTGNYGVASSPINVRPSIIACLGGCCSREVVDGILQWSCSLTCTCGGGYHSFETTALWEGYSKLFVGYASCGCWEDAPDPTPTPSDGPYAASVSANFSKDAVIFEDAYENMPGEWVLRRSTATMLTISANGGTNGAVLSVSATNLGKLQKNSGPAFPSQSVSVPARQSITYAMNYVGLSASDTADDIEVVATLTENSTGAISTSAATTTAVRVELEARYAAPANTNLHRHVFGVLEDFYYRQYPSADSAVWYFYEGEEEMVPFSPGHMILHAMTNETSGGHCEFRVSCGNAAYTNDFLMVLPCIEARNPRCNEEISTVRGEAGWLVLHLDFHIGPSYVSFQGIDFMEIPDESGNCPHGGYYNDVTKGGYLSHCAGAGAGEWNRVDANGFWCHDKAGHAGRYEQPWSDGWKEWPIPIGWGSNRILRGQFDVPPTTQKFMLTSDGAFTIRKFGIEANRGIFDLIPTIRSAEE